MIAYNGGTISKVLLNDKRGEIYVTDTVQRAIRYANAQATKVVNPDLNQEQAANTVVLHVECDPNFIRREDDHGSLDTCEAVVSEYKIIKVTIKRPAYANTLYSVGYRKYGTFEQVIEIIADRGIEVEVI